MPSHAGCRASGSQDEAFSRWGPAPGTPGLQDQDEPIQLPSESARFFRSESPRASVVISAWKSAPLALPSGSFLVPVPPLRMGSCLFSTSRPRTCSRPCKRRVWCDHGRVCRELGSAGACNMGAAAARATTSCCPTTTPKSIQAGSRPWWETADAHPDAGAIGSTVLNSDGTLQEAGELLWIDGPAAAVAGPVVPADLSVLERYLSHSSFAWTELDH